MQENDCDSFFIILAAGVPDTFESDFIRYLSIRTYCDTVSSQVTLPKLIFISHLNTAPFPFHIPSIPTYIVVYDFITFIPLFRSHQPRAQSAISHNPVHTTPPHATQGPGLVPASLNIISCVPNAMDGYGCASLFTRRRVIW